jgi:hypothetical protein
MRVRIVWGDRATKAETATAMSPDGSLLASLNIWFQLSNDDGAEHPDHDRRRAAGCRYAILIEIKKRGVILAPPRPWNEQEPKTFMLPRPALRGLPGFDALRSGGAHGCPIWRSSASPRRSVEISGG